MTARLTTLLFLATLLMSSDFASAQETADDFPPPIKTFPRAERARLDAGTDPGQRVEVALTLLEGYLKKAESLARDENFRASFPELGSFHGVMEHTVTALRRDSRGTNKDFVSFKKLEMALRAFSPRIELIRRDAPAIYRGYLGQLLKDLRDARSRIIEPFYGNDVVKPK